MFFGLVSLGCAKNRVDSEEMIAQLVDRGWEVVNDPAVAEVLIVNTCGFIQSAKEESIEQILEMARYKKKGICKILIVAGCLSQRYAGELSREIPEIDGFVGTGDYMRLPEILERLLRGERVIAVSSPDFLSENAARVLTTPSYSAYLKIAEGCDNYCSYCVIPYIRGKYRSKKKESIIKEAMGLAERQVKEIIVIAQDTSRYGMDIYGKPALADLLHDLHEVPGIHWIRLLYLHPASFEERLVEAIKDLPKVTKYVDLPLQHASPGILKKMNRPGDGKQYLKTIQALREKIPGIFIRSSFIVGFPGETMEDIQCLSEFLNEAGFDRAGFFKYSHEEGTPAYSFKPQIPEEEKERRLQMVAAIQRRISKNLNKQRIGQELEVLITGKTKKGRIVGRSEGDAPEIDGLVYLDAFPAVPGEFYRVKISGCSEYDLTAKPLYKTG